LTDDDTACEATEERSDDIDETGLPGNDKTSVAYHYIFSDPKPENREVKRRPCQFTREDMAEELETAYAMTQPTNPLKYYGVWRENHAEDEQTCGWDGVAATDDDDGARTHYHMLVYCVRHHRWRSVVKFLERRGIYVHCVGSHAAYWSMLRYVAMPSARKPRCELDATPFLSDNHPGIQAACRIPRTAVASAAHAHAAATAKAGQKRRLTKTVLAHNAITHMGCNTAKKLKRHAQREARTGRGALASVTV
jgi:hypothetical protein